MWCVCICLDTNCPTVKLEKLNCKLFSKTVLYKLGRYVILYGRIGFIVSAHVADLKTAKQKGKYYSGINYFV